MITTPKYTSWIGLRVTEEELKNFKLKAKSKGISVSELIRQTVKDM